jgi:hypothetical protein
VLLPRYDPEDVSLILLYRKRELIRYILYTSYKRSAPMRRTVPIGDIVAWPFLLPRNIACTALGLARHRDLVRMLISSLFWTVLGVLVVMLAA